MVAVIQAKAANGRILGRKGLETRQLILDSLETLVRSKPFSGLSISDVVESAKLSMATFYIYFDSLDDALENLVSLPKFRYVEVIEFLKRSWSAEEMISCARRFVHLYFEFWEKNRPVLRLRNLRGDEGNQRFIDIRLGSTLPVVDALAEKIALSKASGHLPSHVPASAYAAFFQASLERNGLAYFHTKLNSRQDLEEASAQILAQWLAPGAA